PRRAPPPPPPRRRAPSSSDEGDEPEHEPRCQQGVQALLASGPVVGCLSGWQIACFIGAGKAVTCLCALGGAVVGCFGGSSGPPATSVGSWRPPRRWLRGARQRDDWYPESDDEEEEDSPRGLDRATIEGHTVGNLPASGSSARGRQGVTEDGGRCMVCMEHFSDGETLRLLPCLHRCAGRCLTERRHLPPAATPCPSPPSEPAPPHLPVRATMARSRSALAATGLALAAALCAGLGAAAFLASPARGRAPSRLAGPGGARAPQEAAGSAGGAASLAAGAATATAFSGATLLPALLLSARVTVSVCAAVARHAKAPVSEYGAPSGVRNFQEMTLGFTSDIAKNNLGESFYRPWVPFVTTIFLFIFGSNWSGALVPWKLLELPEGELAAPTNNINTTVALSLLTSIAYFGGGLVKKGLGYFARYVKPTPILLPINILEDFTKPLSLSFRLFGNVLADELTVAVLTFLVPFVIPLPIMALGIFAGSIQALIFATLASAYIAEAIE
ncbi:unnamed protein product, partial [Prorocentrum cordatum]